MSEKKRLIKAVSVIGCATFLSRVIGYLRDMVIAGMFGTSIFADAFIAAFRIPNFMRRLFAEGTFTIAFIPVFSEYLSKYGKAEAFRLARATLLLVSVCLVALTFIGILAAPIIVKIIAFGFAENASKFDLTVVLTRIMFPYIICISLVALSMGILNTLGHFIVPAVAPALLNIAIIVSVYSVACVSPDNAMRVLGLAVGVLVGGVLQLGIQLPVLIQNGFYFWKIETWYHPGVKKIARLFIPATFASGLYQINSIIITILASTLVDGSISYLYFSERLIQFPLGIFAMSMGTALLPSLSKQAAVNDYRAVSETFAYAMKMVFFIMVPAMVGMIILREPIISLLFQRNAFTETATRMTAQALFYFGIGLWAIAGARIAVPAFYALKDTRTPVIAAIAAVILQILLGLVLLRPMQHCGLALATSLTAMAHFVLLMWQLHKRLGAINMIDMGISIFKTIVCSSIMAAVVWGIRYQTYEFGAVSSIHQILLILVCISAGISSYAVLAHVFKCPELNYFISLIKRKDKNGYVD